MTSPSEKTSLIHYSGYNNTTVSGLLEQQDESKQIKPVRTTILHRKIHQQKREINTL